jgi:CheY-like chemotaxis protein
MICPRPVLLVEHNPADAARITRAFQETGPSGGLVHLDDCERALQYLREPDGQRTGFVLLGLDMPDGGAFRFLEAVKADETLRMIPVVVLAESGEKCAVSASFTLGGAGYVTKSADASTLREQTAAILAYWSLSQLPRIR